MITNADQSIANLTEWKFEDEGPKHKFEFPKEIVARRIPQIKRSRVYNGTVSNLFPTAKARKVDPAKEIAKNATLSGIKTLPEFMSKKLSQSLLLIKRIQDLRKYRLQLLVKE